MTCSLPAYENCQLWPAQLRRVGQWPLEPPGIVMRWRGARIGFSLVELLVVIAILGVLIALILAAVQKVRQAACRAECANHLRQMSVALHQYHDAHAVFPPGCSFLDGADPYPHMTWMTRILPYLEQESLWQESVDAFGQAKFFEMPPHHPILSRPLAVFGCPLDDRLRDPKQFGDFEVAFTSYMGVEGTNRVQLDGVLYLDSDVRLSSIIDGTSNTIMVGERPPSADGHFGWWYAGWGQKKDGSCDSVLGVQELNQYPGTLDTCPPGPYEYGPGRISNQCDVFHFWSLHGGGANFMLADGSVRFFSYSAVTVMPALATRAGGEVFSPVD